MLSTTPPPPPPTSHLDPEHVTRQTAYLPVGAQLHALQRGQEVYGHHGRQPLSLDLQLRVAVSSKRLESRIRSTSAAATPHGHDDDG